MLLHRLALPVAAAPFGEGWPVWVDAADRIYRKRRRRLRVNLTRSYQDRMNRSPAPPRELSRTERAAIRRLVKSLCANYDSENGCLPLDAPCYMLGKWWTGAYCRYFENALLPLDPVLEAALSGQGGGTAYKVCSICGGVFYPVTSQAYCSAACRAKGDRDKARLRQRRHRYQKGT